MIHLEIYTILNFLRGGTEVLWKKLSTTNLFCKLIYYLILLCQRVYFTSAVSVAAPLRSEAAYVGGFPINFTNINDRSFPNDLHLKSLQFFRFGKENSKHTHHHHTILPFSCRKCWVTLAKRTSCQSNFSKRVQPRTVLSISCLTKLCSVTTLY